MENAMFILDLDTVSSFFTLMHRISVRTFYGKFD